MDILDLITEIFTDYTLRTVALGSAVLGLVSGVLGSYAVLRKQALLGDAMSHAALPGVVLAFLLLGSKAPLGLLVGAIVAGWLGALFVLFVTRNTRIKEDSSLGIVLAVFFAIGIALLSWIQRNQASTSQSGLDKFLFGRAAALVERDVLLMILVGGSALVVVVLFWKEFKILSFNPEYAATLGFPVRVLDIVLTTLIVIAIVVGLQTVGVVLMSAMVIAPAVAARQWTDRLSVMLLLAGFFGATAGLVGSLISALGRGLSTGPVIVLTISAIAFLSLFIAPNRGLIGRWLLAQRNRRRLRTSAILEMVYLMAMHHEDPLHPHSVEMLQAAMPRKGVAFTLRELERNELVLHVIGKGWSLTPQGVQEAERILASGETDPGEIRARANEVHEGPQE